MDRSPLLRDARHARAWFGLAISVLILAGLFALLLVIARMPPFDRMVTDAGFFRRCLVVHVTLSLVLWFYSFVVGLLFLLPARRGGARLASCSAPLAWIGVGLMVVAAWWPGTQPVMSNYIPMIDHPAFALGLAAAGAGMLAAVLSRRLLPVAHVSWMPVSPAVHSGLRAAALALFLAALTFFSARLALTPGLEPKTHYELLFWGGGHVLQLASVIGMLVVWLLLASSVLGRSPVSQRAGAWLFGLLLLPWLVSPLLPMGGTWTALYRDGFTHLMRWGLFPVVVVVAVLCWIPLRRARRAGDASLRDPRVSAFAISVGLTGAGFLLGALIRGSNTVVPAHYHASIGAVTVAFMAVTYTVLEHLAVPVPAGRWRRTAAWQPALYGGGQLVFALGFALAGARGMTRKTYGVEQAGRDFVESTGLVVMGVGGFVAIAGGLLFLSIVAVAWLRRPARASLDPRPALRS